MALTAGRAAREMMPTSRVGEVRAEYVEREEAEGDVASISRRSVSEATRSLAALLAAGLPLTRALETTRDVVGQRLAQVLDAVLTDVRTGVSLAQALAEHPNAFDPLYVGVVRAGERSGRLVHVTQRLAAELEREDELRERIISASIYPAALVLLGGVSLFLLLLLVVPRFAELLVDAGAELPAVTMALLATSELVRSYWAYLTLAGVAGAVSLGAYGSSPQGRQVLASVALGLPVIGSIRRGLLAARFTRLLSVLLDGGAPVVSGLSDAASSLPDPVATALHRAIAAGTLFPDELARLVAVGEESGRLAEFLERAADFYERRSVRAMERAVTLLEPAVIVLFGGLVAIVALALLQAIYGVNAGSFG
jgi:general secretion pathway protein F